MRLQKFLSRAGVCSRRDGEQLMEEGRVEVNGQPCRQMGSKVDPEADQIAVDGQPVALPEEFTYLLLNKPKGCITTLDDPRDRETVVDYLPENLPRIWPVGRLDADSAGALLLTNDGRLTNGLTHPSFESEKVYRVTVEPSFSNRSRKLNRLRKGVQIGEGEWTSPAKVSVLEQNEGATELRVALIEGKNRQIRRMIDVMGHRVVELRRIAIGPIELGELKPGKTRELLSNEVEALYEETGQNIPDKAIT